MSSWDQANRRQKLGFGLEKQKENQPNYQRLLSLTILSLNYFMISWNMDPKRLYIFTLLTTLISGSRVLMLTNGTTKGNRHVCTENKL